MLRFFLFTASGVSLSLLFVACAAAPTATPMPSPTSTPRPTASATPPPQTLVKIHYLGHASFILEFSNGLTVLTDYGQSKAYGMDSPIYDLKRLPDIATYSHTHPDHYAPTRLTGEVQHILQGPGSNTLALEGLSIQPIPAYEKAAGDNNGYLFTYQGVKILHTGDIQGYLAQIRQAETQAQVKTAYVGPYDLILVPIDGINSLVQEAEIFIDLLQPRRVIPMHYWSQGVKDSFLKNLAQLNSDEGRNYQIDVRTGADYELLSDAGAAEPVQVISLTAAP